MNKSDENTTITSAHNDNCIKRYSLFQSDDVFYTVIIVLVISLIIFGIILLVCMVCKPSYWHQVLLTSHPIEFLHDSNDKTVSEFTITNTFNKPHERINSGNEYDNKTEPKPDSMQNIKRNISILDTRLPPLEPQENNSIKPREIIKLRDALEKVEHPQDDNYLDGMGMPAEKKTFEQLDITSLTHMDDGFD
jgi:hypothetical protein